MTAIMSVIMMNLILPFLSGIKKGRTMIKMIVAIKLILMQVATIPLKE